MATNEKGDRPRGGGWDILAGVLSGGDGGRRQSRPWRSRLDRSEADSYHERMTAEREMRRMSALWYRLFPIDYDAIPVAGYEPMPDGTPDGVDEGLLVPGIAAEAIAAGLGLADKGGEEEPQPVAETHSDTSNRNTVMFGNSALATLLSRGAKGESRGAPRVEEPSQEDDGASLPGELDELYDEAQGLLASLPEERDDGRPVSVEEDLTGKERLDEALFEESREEQAEEAAREWAEIEGEIADARHRVASGLDAIDMLSEGGSRHARHDAGEQPFEAPEEELGEEELRTLEAEVVAKVAAERGEVTEDAVLDAPPAPERDAEEQGENPVAAGVSGRFRTVMGRIRSAVGRGEKAAPEATQPPVAGDGGNVLPGTETDDDATQPFRGMPDDDATQPFRGMPDDDATQPFQGMPDDDATQPFRGMPDDDATQPVVVPEDMAGHATTGTGQSGAQPEAKPMRDKRVSSGRIGSLEAHIPADGEFALPLVGGQVNAKVKVMPAQGILLGGHARRARTRGSSSVRLRVRASKVNLRAISLIGPGRATPPSTAPSEHAARSAPSRGPSERGESGRPGRARSRSDLAKDAMGAATASARRRPRRLRIPRCF